jgi:drug/metabolite transporter (DMT)-like permease
MLLGVLGHGVYQVCFIEGLARTPAGTAALVFAACPAFIAIFGRLFGTERVSGRGWAGIALQLAGMVAVVAGSAARMRPGGDRSLLGLALVLAGCICWALFTVLLKPYTERIDGLQLSAWTMAGGVVLLGVLAVPALAVTPWSQVGAPAWGAVLYSGIGALVVAYLFWYNGVKTIGPTRTAMFSNLQPIIALVVAYFLLHEVPTAAQLGGATAIMSGLLLSRS